MAPTPATLAWRLPRAVRSRLDQPQHRSAYYLTLNNVMAAATGILFWLLLARVAGLGPAVIGLGYTVVSLGTIVGTLAKGGFDTALLVKVPGAGSAEGRRLLSLGFAVTAGFALLLTAALAATALGLGFMPGVDGFGWVLVGAIAVLMLMTWLQDAYFLAVGRARMTFQRNLVLTAGRILLPLPVVLLAFAHPVPLTWALALAASGLVGAARLRALPARIGSAAPRRAFLRTAARNVTGGAAEFLPGLLLAPLVFVLHGPEAAAYFGIAWTAASLIFQISGVIGRSALAQMVQAGPQGAPSALRRALLQQAWVVAPLALLVALSATPLLGLFGPAYASEGALALVILCASIVVVAPVALYLAVLRAGDRGWPLVAFPVAMILTLAAVAPVLGMRYGLAGIAGAWFAANAPIGLYAAFRLRRAINPRLALPEVMPYAEAAPVLGRADLE